MKTKRLLMMMTIAAAMSASIAMADNMAPVTAPAGQDNKAQHEQKFAEHKAKALQRLQEHAAKIQQKQACVQAATDGPSLKACFPNRGKGGDRDDRKEEGKGQ